MGYDSNYSLRIQALNNEQALRVIRDIEEESNKTLQETGTEKKDTGQGWAEIDEVHWYDWETDVANVAARYPDVIIEVHRSGEEWDDKETVRFKGTDKEAVTIQMFYPPFKKILFSSEMGTSCTTHFSERINDIRAEVAETVKEKIAALGGKIDFSHYHDEGVTTRSAFYEPEDYSPNEVYLESVDTGEDGKPVLELSDWEKTVDYHKYVDDFTITELMAVLEEVEQIEAHICETGEQIVTGPEE